MEFRIDFWPGTPEAAIIGEAIIKLGAIRTRQKDAAEPSPLAAGALAIKDDHGNTVTEVKAETTAIAPRTRKARPKPETIAAKLGMTDLTNTPPELLAPAEPAADFVAQTVPVVIDGPIATSAKKVWAVKELEDMVRAAARSDFDKMAALLAEYKVPRFGVLPVEKHQEFGDKLAAL